MYDAGYQNIVNIDVGCGSSIAQKGRSNSSHQYSSVVIEQMKRRHGHLKPGMEWHEMDIRDLKFDDASFDVAIDKGLMFDSKGSG